MARKATKKTTKKKAAVKKNARKAATRKAAVTRKKSVNSSRKEGQTQISISLSIDLLNRIDQSAELENRNRSNFIKKMMLELVESK